MSKLRCFDDQGNRLFVDKCTSGNLWKNYSGGLVSVDLFGGDARTVVASYGPRARGEWNDWADVAGDVLLIVSSERVSD